MSYRFCHFKPKSEKTNPKQINGFLDNPIALIRNVGFKLFQLIMPPLSQHLSLHYHDQYDHNYHHNLHNNHNQHQHNTTTKVTTNTHYDDHRNAMLLLSGREVTTKLGKNPIFEKGSVLRDLTTNFDKIKSIFLMYIYIATVNSACKSPKIYLGL